MEGEFVNFVEIGGEYAICIIGLGYGRPCSQQNKTKLTEI